MELRDREKIQKRLAEFRDLRCPDKTLAALAKDLKLPRNTVTRWFGSARKTMRVPDSEKLIRLARVTGLSLDWLLLGEGPMLRRNTTADDTLPEQFRADLVAYLFTTEPDLEGWKRPTREQVERAVPPAAVTYRLGQEAIRPRVWKALETIQGGDALVEEIQADPEVDEKRRTRLIRDVQVKATKNLAAHHETTEVLARLVTERHRGGHVAYQIVTERMSLTPV